MRHVWDRLLAALGAPAAQVRVEVEGQVHPRGSVVRGCVVVQGGEVTQEVRALDLRMSEYMPGTAGESPSEALLHVEILATDLVVAPQAQHRFPFALSLPDDALLTSGGLQGLPALVLGLPTHSGEPEGATHGVSLSAQAYIRRCVDPVGVASLRVVPQPEVIAVYDAVPLLGFAPILAPRPCAHSRGTVVDYIALEERGTPPALPLSLELWTKDQYVVGKLSTGGGLLARADRPHAEVRIPRAELRSADGAVSPAAAVPYLQRALADAAASASANRLVRASSDPSADISRLVRPAGAAESPAERLVRPAEDGPRSGDAGLPAR